MDTQDPHPKRTRTRLRYYDYRQTGVYFVTICTSDRRSTLGSIRSGVFTPTPLGRLAEACWRAIPKHSSRVELDQHFVMPNHVHGLVILDSPSIPSESRRAPGELRPFSLGAVVGAYKAAVTRTGRAHGIVSRDPVWQRGFWEHIVRGPKALDRIRRYIIGNPARWGYDRENRDRCGEDPFYFWNNDQGATPPK